jgi:sugar transferase (PEP-CTERM system associated)
LIRVLNAYFPARTLFLGLSEAVLATLAFVLAMMFDQGSLNATIALNYEQGYTKIALIVGTFVVCMYYFDLYDSKVFGNRRELFTRIVQVMGTLCLILAFVYYQFPFLRLGTEIFLEGTALATCGLLCSRRLFLFVNTIDRVAEQCIILGNGLLAETLISELAERPELGFRVVSRISEDQERLPNEGLQTASFTDELGRTVERQRITRIIVAMSERRGKMPVESLLQLKTLGIKIQDGVELYEQISGKIALQSLRLSWLLFSPVFQASRYQLIYKRLFSLCLSAICLLIALPFMLVIALAIRLDSRGPVIFRQERVGKNGKIFTLYKFRSMVDGTDGDGIFRPAEKNDKRVTRFGRWLRAIRLDELPQLFNIFRGDMYFVGPRPFVPNQEEDCVRHIPFYKQRWSVRPGATGWAQVSRDYCATIEENADKLAYDLFYIKNMSVGLDLFILFKTLKILLLGRGGR